MALSLPMQIQAQPAAPAPLDQTLGEVQVRDRHDGGYKAQKAASPKFTRPLGTRPRPCR
jgi:catecholate siderophore receptor